MELELRENDFDFDCFGDGLLLQADGQVGTYSNNSTGSISGWNVSVSRQEKTQVIIPPYRFIWQTTSKLVMSTCCLDRFDVLSRCRWNYFTFVDAFDDCRCRCSLAIWSPRKPASIFSL